MAVQYVAHASPAGVANNTITTASFDPPDDGRQIFALAIQVTTDTAAAPLAITNTTITIVWTLVEEVSVLLGAHNIRLALWRGVSGGPAGTVNVANNAAGSRVTELRVFSTPNGDVLDQSTGNGGTLWATAFDFESPYQWSSEHLSVVTETLSIATTIVVERGTAEVTLDPRPGWSQIEQWDTLTAGSVMATILMSSRIGPLISRTTGTALPTMTWYVNQGDGLSALGHVFSVYNTEPKIRPRRMNKSRGNKIHTNWY